MAVGFAAIEVPEPVVAPEPEPKVEEPADTEEAAPVEVKFNPWHDPENGQFTFAEQGTRSGGGDQAPSASNARAPSSVSMRATKTGVGASGTREKPSTRWSRMSSAERLADPEVKAAAHFHAIAQRAVLSDQTSERFVYGVGEGQEGQLSRVERPTGIEVRRQVAAKLELLVRNRLDKGIAFPGVTEAELRRGDTPAARAYATLVKTAVANAYNDRERQALTFFIRKGWQPHQAVAIVASLKKESFLDPGAVQGGGGEGRGIAQWTVDGPRDMTFRGRNGGIKIADASYAQQLEFVNHELHNPVVSKQGTLADYSYQKAGNGLRKATKLNDAVSVVLTKYEKAGASGQIAERTSIANAIYSYWAKVPGVFQPAGK